MNMNEVIKYPILTEKTNALIAHDAYTFAVDPRTNRAEVKKAVEFIFQVKVAKVNIINVAKQPAKLGKSEGFTNKIKKAIVVLQEGKIHLYPDEAGAGGQDQKVETSPKPPSNKEPSAAEAKAAAKIAAEAKPQANKQAEEQAQVGKDKVVAALPAPPADPLAAPTSKSKDTSGGVGSK